MKKSAAKPAAAKTPAPAAPKTDAPAKPAPVAKKASADPKPVKIVAKPAAAKASAPKAKTPKAKAPAAAAPITTTIAATIDVGFGNHLTLRGEGPGLSWEKGVPLECVADDRWLITLPESSQPVVFKFLINDVTWSAGEDYTALSGSSVVLTPSF